MEEIDNHGWHYWVNYHFNTNYDEINSKSLVDLYRKIPDEEIISHL